MKKKIIIIIPIIIAAVAFMFAYRYYNNEDPNTTLTVAERRWVTENAGRTFDFEVINDYPLYGMNGEGVFFRFIEDFEENIGIQFNKIPYLKGSDASTNSFRIRILRNDEELTENDLLIFEDNYIAIGRDFVPINRIPDMRNITFGVFEDDLEELAFYLRSGQNLSYETFESIDELFEALDDEDVDMVIIPQIMYLERTIDSEYAINYFFTEMRKQIVLTLSDEYEELNEIMAKYFRRWMITNYINVYNEIYLNFYFEQNNIDAQTRTALTSKTYVYGFVDNPPYEALVNDRVAGIAGEYINRISRLAGIDFEYRRFSSKEALQQAVDNGEIDVFFNFFNVSNDNFLETLSPFIEYYVVLGRTQDQHIVTSFEQLRGQELAMLDGNLLYTYFSNNSGASITTFDSINDLMRNKEDRLVVLDREIYNHFKHHHFSRLSLLYMDTMMSDYRFLVRNDNEAFYNLFNYIMNTNSFFNYRNAGLSSLNASIFRDLTFEQVYTTILLIIFLPLIILALIYFFLKRKRKVKKVRIVDRHKYTDMLTSLKNRNYLSAKMAEWEDSKVYPQAIVMMDLNNVKYVNDNYGHEEGDMLIVKAAGVLVNTQLENSEIMRTDGNEFLIYLVGYNERQISMYVKKLTKELKALPHEFGAGVGYSMIMDSIKTIDDAINEATLDMITNKEDFK